MTLDIASLIFGMILMYLIRCMIMVWKHQTIPNIKDYVGRVNRKNQKVHGKNTEVTMGFEYQDTQ